MFAHGLTVTVERPAGTDRYGNPLPPEAHTIDGCGLAPRSSDERTDGQAQVVDSYSLFAPYGSDLRSQDRVRLPWEESARWHVEGEPGHWRSPFNGWEAGMSAVLTRVEG